MHASEKAAMKLLIYFTVLYFLALGSESTSRMDYQTKLELAREHNKRVASQISCHFPRPRIYRVGTSPSMKLLPAATVLHRCGDQSGCCTLATYKCVPKTKEKVKLYFLVKSFPGRIRKRSKIKKFVFTNHTECHCADMSYRPR